MKMAKRVQPPLTGLADDVFFEKEMIGQTPGVARIMAGLEVPG